MNLWLRKCHLILERRWRFKMDKNAAIVGSLLDDCTVSFIEICEVYKISEQQLLEVLDNGLIPDIANFDVNSEFDSKMLQRILRALRLQNDLGVNPAGAVLASELLDELEALTQELNVLKKHMNLR